MLWSFKTPGHFTSYMDGSPLHYEKICISLMIWTRKPPSHGHHDQKSLFTVNNINVKVLCVSIYIYIYISSLGTPTLYWTWTCLALTASSLFRLLSAGAHAHPRRIWGLVTTGVQRYYGDWWEDPDDGQGLLWTLAQNFDKRVGLLATQFIAPCGSIFSN